MTKQQLQHEQGTRVMLFSSEFRHLTPCSSGLTILLPYLAHILVGSSGLPGDLLSYRSHNRHCYPLQKGMKSLRGLSIQPGEIMAKKKKPHGDDTGGPVLLGGAVPVPDHLDLLLEFPWPAG